MIKTVLCTLTIFCVLAISAQEQVGKKSPRRIDEPTHYYTAETYLDMNDADRMVYTTGLMDGFYASALFGASNTTAANLSSCTKNMDSKQVSAIVTKYVKDHPETWHYPLSVDAYGALNGACPGGLKTIN